MMAFTIIHPSRGRAKLAYQTRMKWEGKRLGIQYILSLDADDPQLELYRSLFQGCQVLVNVNKNLVDAVQAAVPLIKNDCVIVVSDDFDCPENWDIVLNEKLRDLKFYGAYVNDGYSYGKQVMTLPILSRSLVEQLGYIYYPAYTGMFADNDLYEALEMYGWLINIDSSAIFQHNHYCNGKASIDATYKRHNNNESWRIGETLIEQRRKNGFDFGKTPLLSILIATIDERAEKLKELLERFNDIRGGEMIEIVVESDNKKMPIGKKRNKLLDRAKGEWVVYFDDDDYPYDNYVKNILSAIRTHQDIDCIGIWGIMTTNGSMRQRWCHRLGYPIAGGHIARQKGFDYIRPIIHFNPVKRELALKARFNDKLRFGEDMDYASRLNPLLKKEFFIANDPLFHYRYTNKQSPQEKYGTKI